ncbi:MAG TPA: hypothetical protein PKK59_03540 [Anaerolineaceae bacterium]|nr:hypothetical protein [Anaerolineaceae bacterium]
MKLVTPAALLAKTYQVAAPPENEEAARSMLAVYNNIQPEIIMVAGA